MQEYFQNMVNSSVDTSINHVRAYVHNYLSDNIRAARSKISGYGEMYGEIMQKALEIKSRSKLPLQCSNHLIDESVSHMNPFNLQLL